MRRRFRTGLRAATRSGAFFWRAPPRSSNGDALKDLSLHGRLFANRCSFLVYSESFTALPAPLKARILGRLAAVLRGDDPRGRYSYLGEAEKRRILEILAETHPDARLYFRTAPQ